MAGRWYSQIVRSGGGKIIAGCRWYWVNGLGRVVMNGLGYLHYLVCQVFILTLYVVRCAIWYHLYNLKNMKNTHGGVLILVKLQATTYVL